MEPYDLHVVLLDVIAKLLGIDGVGKNVAILSVSELRQYDIQIVEVDQKIENYFRNIAFAKKMCMPLNHLPHLFVTRDKGSLKPLDIFQLLFGSERVGGIENFPILAKLAAKLSPGSVASFR